MLRPVYEPTAQAFGLVGTVGPSVGDVLVSDAIPLELDGDLYSAAYTGALVHLEATQSGGANEYLRVQILASYDGVTYDTVAMPAGAEVFYYADTSSYAWDQRNFWELRFGLTGVGGMEIVTWPVYPLFCHSFKVKLYKPSGSTNTYAVANSYVRRFVMFE